MVYQHPLQSEFAADPPTSLHGAGRESTDQPLLFEAVRHGRQVGDGVAEVGVLGGDTVSRLPHRLRCAARQHAPGGGAGVSAQTRHSRHSHVNTRAKYIWRVLYS